MNNIRLNNRFTFAVEQYNGKLRFIVYENNTECVCRIERRKAIDLFLQSATASIFKGRLQLHKHYNEIAVEVKGEVIGKVECSLLNSLIENS